MMKNVNKFTGLRPQNQPNPNCAAIFYIKNTVIEEK
jgi:hypothetical protein